MTNDLDLALKNYVDLGTAVSKLQNLSLPILEESVCKEAFNSYRHSVQICAGGNIGRETSPSRKGYDLLKCHTNIQGEDSCSGDSGGPLFVKDATSEIFFQTGIVSFGSKMCGTGKPGIYTRISNYIDWIAENLEP